MTFVIAYARPDLGLVAADTRLSERYWGVDGTGEIAPPHPVSDSAHKLFPISGGWLLSALPPAVTALLEPELLALRGVDAIGPTMRVLRARLQGTQLPEGLARRLEAGCVWGLSAVDARIAYRGWTLAGDEYLSPSRGEVGFALPPGADGPEATHAVIAYRNELLERERSWDLPALLRRTAALFAEIHGRCGPVGAVSEEVEIGLLELGHDGRARHRYLGPAVTREVRGASDTTLIDALQVLGSRPVSPPRRGSDEHEMVAISRRWFALGETAVWLFSARTATEPKDASEATRG